ncbi:Pyrroline-5-carboxylate reductase [Thalictrum thalictroides]|uniref:Pyrroline-5-carboxylate reductase n=1 Tax=Thalictrum thalictroides TaxID=46969 RepID=A0A7J6WHJ8_THATH|nr:Pyrroline-5-carboxylate reductase [Thalictrum thalictroides]
MKEEETMKSMADESIEQNPNTNINPSILKRILSKRRTWVCLFISVYALLLSFSWNLLHSILDWYNSTTSSSSGSGSFGWPALYASILFGAVFGLLSMAAAVAIAIPATVVTWITVLVLLTFAGKPRKALVLEGRNITKDIVGFVIKIVIKEGNVVAVICAVIGYFALVGRNGDEDS